MNDLSDELRKSLYAFREDHDNVREILLRQRRSQGPAWAIREFQVLTEIHDYFTVAKAGNKLKKAKRKVDHLIRYQVFKHVERKYMLDENNEVVLRPEQQQQLELNNPSPMVRAPGGVPYNAYQYTGPVYQYTGPVHQYNVTGTVDNSVTHHHSGADKKDIEDLQTEQKKQGKEIGDLKKMIENLTVAHTNLRTTVHNELKKKPLCNNEVLPN